jgi:hypothetical protein
MGGGAGRKKGSDPFSTPFPKVAPASLPALLGLRPNRALVLACAEEPWLIRKILGHVRRRETLTGITARGPPTSQHALDPIKGPDTFIPINVSGPFIGEGNEPRLIARSPRAPGLAR